MFRTSFFLLLGTAIAFSQEPPNRRPIVPPAVPAQPAAAAAPAAAPDVPLGETKITEDINEPKLSGESLAGLYRKYTGKRIIVTSAASAAEFKFIQPASEDDPLTFDEAAALLRKAAVLEGFVFVPDSENPAIETLTLATGGVNPKQIGLEIYNENTPLPEGDKVISYVMTFNYLKPAEAVNIFTQTIGQIGAFGSIAAVPNASAVIVTENTSLIRKLIELKRQIDVGAKSDSEFISVRFTDVTELATTLNELLSAQSAAQSTANINRVGQPQQQPNNPNRGAAPQGQPADSGEVPPVQIIPDPRTNRIFVMGHPKDIALVRSLVASFDIETSEKNFLRRKLRYLSVSEFLPVASDALTRAFSGTGDSGGGGGRPGGSGNRPAAPQNRGSTSGGLGSSAFGRNSSSSSSPFNDSSSSSSGGLSGGASSSSGSGLGDPAANTAPESVLIGRTLLVADNITNSIVVQGPPSALEIVTRLLDQIDIKAPQVMISTVFGQLNLNKGLSTGVDWLKAFNPHGDGSGYAGSNLGTDGNRRDPANFLRTAVGAASGFPSSTGLSLYGKITNDVAAYVNLLETSGNFTILSRPSVVVTNNQKGTISSGRRIAVPTNSFNSGATGQSTNIEYRDVVLKLEVVPLVNSNNEVTLKISLVSDDVVGQSDVIQGIGRVPIIGTRELLTTATIPNRETIILGGLITESDRSTVTGIPILSSIPGLGRLFSTNNDTKDRDELLVFIQPNIMHDDIDKERIQVDTDARYKLASQARRMSEGPGVQVVPIEPGKGGDDVFISPEGETMKPTLRPIHRR
ncbi:MAG: secretin N-terminal domain-containing protein [Verrucomicrobiota bacterium]